MMNKIISTLILGISLISFFACQKENLSNSNLTNILNKQFDEESVISISSTSIEGQHTGVHISGEFTDGEESLQRVNSFKVNEHQIPLVNDRYIANFPDVRLGTVSILSEIAGQDISINVDNTFNSNISDFKFTYPTPVTMSILGDKRNMSREGGLRLNWNTNDIRLREEPKVAVNLTHRGTNDENDEVINANLSKLVDDNGELFITEEELSIFPINSKIDVNIIRADHELINHSSDIETLIVAYSIDSHRIILID